MGNKKAKHDIYNDIRNSIFLTDSDLYSLIGKDGGGILVELVHEALKLHDFTKLDDYLRNEIKKFMYNDGEGKNVINNFMRLIYKK